MAWAIITIYISKCAQMNPQQLPKTSKFYSRCKKCDIKISLGVGTTPLGSPKVKRNLQKCHLHLSRYDTIQMHPGNISSLETQHNLKAACKKIFSSRD